ncbi:MAG: hypothetical protein HOB73_03995 [Planctomycetaceae bacterium]|nr:hypothetical protein [Planctomycetaceae bacterium]
MLTLGTTALISAQPPLVQQIAGPERSNTTTSRSQELADAPQSSPFSSSVQPVGFRNNGDSEEPLNLRLRIAWGGGAPRQWRGTITISAGELQDLVPRSIEPITSAHLPAAVASTAAKNDNSGGLVRLNSPVGAQASGQIKLQTVFVQQNKPSQFDAFDISITAARQAVLTVDLVALSDSNIRFQLQRPLAFFITRDAEVVLDNMGNRGQVRRLAGDRLRIITEREHLVFQPQELFELTLRPNQLGENRMGNYQYELDVIAVAENLNIHHQQRVVEVTTADEFPAWNQIKIPIPTRPGIYNIRLALRSKRFSDTLVRSSPLAQRVVQIVVVGGKSPVPTVATKWREITNYNPADPSWWQRLRELDPTNRIKYLAGSSPSSIGFAPFGNRRAEKIQHHDKSMTRLGSGGWQALPLKIENPQRPHLLEIEYPSDVQQTAAVSILEPNALGKIGPLGVDTGWNLDDTSWQTTPETLTHKVLIWPNTNTPMLVIRNQLSGKPVVFGKIRIQQLQGNLADLYPELIRQKQNRLALAYYKKPLFAENFSSREAVGPDSVATLDDWSTFYDGGQRLVQYLQFAGNNGAVVNVLSEGSSLFPSDLFHATPKYDSGAFFDNGQDPLKKDVLEMLYQMFDERQLVLIPSIQLNMPLNELEQQLQHSIGSGGVDSAIGIRLTSADTGLTGAGTVGRYNPLDPRVQLAIRNLIKEMVQRYHEHPSFAGINIEFIPDSYTHLRNSKWGLDSTTLRRFFQDQEIQPSDLHANNVNAVRTSLANEWDLWKQQRLSKLYKDIAADIDLFSKMATGNDNRHPQRLYLSTAELYETVEIQRQAFPTLPSKNKLINITRNMSINPALTRGVENLVWLSPHKANPVVDPTLQNIDIELAQSVGVHQLFSQSELHGAVFFHAPTVAQLPQLDAKSPWGAGNTQTWFANTITPSHFYNRQRFISKLAKTDCRVLVDGGWFLPLGQEDHLRDLLTTYQQLPDVTFETIKNKPNPIPQPLVIRRYVESSIKDGTKTHLYVLNNSPWAVTAQIDINMQPDGVPVSLSQKSKSTYRWHLNGATWQVVMEPFDLVAIRIDRVEARVVSASVQFNKDVIPKLQENILAVNQQLSRLEQPKALRINNGDFEDRGVPSLVNGWIFDKSAGNLVAVGTAAAQRGQRYLELQRTTASENVLWVRSEPFAVPTTGRIAFSVWLRTKDTAQAPTVRLAIEGRYYGQPYYRPRTIGGLQIGRTSNQQRAVLHTDWTKYVIVVDDLPVRGLTDIRVGFDLMSAGQVEIDNLEVYDLWFQPREYRELMKEVSLAYSHQKQGRVADSHQFLSAFWPRYISRYTPQGFPEVARRLDDTINDGPETPQWPSMPNVLQQFKELPQKLFPF